MRAKTVLNLRCSVREGEMGSQKHDMTVESPHMYSKDKQVHTEYLRHARQLDRCVCVCERE
jgi:hypothetical protein